MDHYIYVYGPSGSGKTLNKDKLKEFFGCKSVYEEQLSQRLLSKNCPALILVTTRLDCQNIMPFGFDKAHINMMHIDMALSLLENPIIPYSSKLHEPSIIME